MNPIPLRLLVLEDVPNDAELAITELEEAGYTCDWKRVETREEFLAELDVPEYDIILSDYGLPSFDGLTALKLLQDRKHDIPFILVSGTLGEEEAIESLKAGATDYVLKTRLSRLAPVVKRALEEFEVRRERHRADKAVKKHMNELEQFNKMAVGRELRMIELKQEVNALCRELGREDAYPSRG